MDIILLIIGLIFVTRKNWAWVITIIAILGSSYLQVPISDVFFKNFLFQHEVKDAALILELVTVFYFATTYGVARYSIPLKQIILIFLFLVLSGFIDIYNMVDVGDVVRQWRHWLLLTIVLIAPYLEREIIEKSYKQLFYITAVVCLYLLFTRFTGVNFIELNIYEIERGIKPPSFAIIFAFISVVNPWNFSQLKRWGFFLIFVVPIVLNLKMTYIVSIALLIGVYVLLVSSLSLAKKIVLSILLVLSGITMLSFNDKMAERVETMASNVKVLDVEDMHADNFSFRLLHAQERLDYITSDPLRVIRGLGFVAEKNINQQIFNVGLYDSQTGKIRQVDTGDIAWSVFFCRFGLVGLVIFLLFYIKLLHIHWIYRKEDPMAAFMASILIVFLIFTSFGNTLIAMDDFYLYPILFANNLLGWSNEYEFSNRNSFLTYENSSY